MPTRDPTFCVRLSALVAVVGCAGAPKARFGADAGDGSNAPRYFDYAAGQDGEPADGADYSNEVRWSAMGDGRDPAAWPHLPIQGVSDHARGSLRYANVEGALRARAHAFLACDLRGTAVLRIVVDGSGRVTFAEVYRQHLTSGSSECLLDAVRGTVFPAPGGGDAEALLPFVFRPKDAGP